jgi:Na+-driven multidrug efflux pump
MKFLHSNHMMELSYSKREIRRDIFKLAWPTITEQLLIMMVCVVSTILVARLEGRISTYI